MGGEIAVELFFIISGFYMALILNEKYNTSDKTVVFYKNRFLKLFPIYWTILILTVSLFFVSYLALNKGGVLEHIINNLSNLGFFSIYVLFSNIFLIGEDLLMFLGFNGDSIIFTKSFSDTDMPFHKFIIVPQSWTLSLEIMFYLMAPFIARRSIKLLVSLFSLSIFIKIGLWNIGFINDPWSYRFILSELSFFFIGMIMYKVYKFGLYSKIIGNKSLFFIGLSLFLVSGYFYYDLKTILDFNEVDTFKYMIYFLFILFLPLLFVQTKDNKVDRYIGELSYPVYIVHIFVILFVSKIANDTNLSLFAIIGSILFSIILNKYIQEKVEKIRMKNLKEKNQMTTSYPLATSTWDEKELEAIQSVINRDMYTMGESVAQFEKDFCKFTGSKYAVMVSSGSTANLIATAALFYTKNPKLKRGDEVIVPAVSWSTTYYPLYQYGLKLKFVDIDLESLNYDLDALKEAITENTKMIMVVNLLGNPNDFDIINEIIKDKDIIVLEDNCESMGAEYKGKQAGTFGLMGTFSTFFSHHMATMEGGFVVTDDEELYHILLSLRAHGWTRNLPKENKVCIKSDNWFEESFRFVLPGYNVRPVEMSGAIGIEQLKKLPNFLAKRRENAKLFQELFSNHPDFIIQKDICNSSWFGFSLIIKPTSKLKRVDIVKKLMDAKIDCRPIVTGNFTRNDVMKYFDFEIHGELKNADYLHENGLFVGNHQIGLENEIKYLAKVLS